jgi:hypothetical protein
VRQFLLSDGDGSLGMGERRSRVFLSYRRSDTSAWSGRLHTDLLRSLGSRLFMDTGGASPGDDFEVVVRESLARSRVVIAMIGPVWLESLNSQPSGKTDYVKVELAASLSDEDITVIPVLVGGAEFPPIITFPRN